MNKGSNLIQRSLFLLLSMIVFGPACFAQSTPMINYTVDDGLPSNIVYDVIRDSNGFLWFATDKGVVRYNGISFEVFMNGDG